MALYIDLDFVYGISPVQTGNYLKSTKDLGLIRRATVHKLRVNALHLRALQFALRVKTYRFPAVASRVYALLILFVATFN